METIKKERWFGDVEHPDHPTIEASDCAIYSWQGKGYVCEAAVYYRDPEMPPAAALLPPLPHRYVERTWIRVETDARVGEEVEEARDALWAAAQAWIQKKLKEGEDE